MMTPWEMGQAAMPLILAVALLRLVLKKRLSRAAFDALWTVALARLLVPLRVPFRFSIHTLLRTAEAYLASAGPLVPKAQAIQPLVATAAQEAMPAIDGIAQTVQPNTDWYIWLWLAVAVALAAYHAVGYVRLRRRFAQSLPVDNPRLAQYVRAQGLRRHVSLRQTDQINSPLTYGVIRPVILLPRRALSLPQEALAFMLDHEMAHIRRFDAATKLLLVLALCLHWYNPLVWLMRSLAVRDMEVACDERVVRLRGQQRRAAYALTLLGMEERRGIVSPLMSSFSQYATEERINAIMNMKKKSAPATLLALVMILTLTAVFATSALAAEALPAQAGTPAETVAWYTYDEYATWLAAERQEIQALVSIGAWTQAKADETVALYESILRLIGEGVQVSKPMADGDMLMSDVPVTIVPSITAAARTYTATDTAAQGASISITRADGVTTSQAVDTEAVYTVMASGETTAAEAVSVFTVSEGMQPAQAVTITRAPGISLTQGADQVTITRADDLGTEAYVTVRVEGDGQTASLQVQRADTLTVPAQAYATQHDNTAQLTTARTGYTAHIALGGQITVDLGPYDTAGALGEAVAAFCQAQVAAGLLTAQEAYGIVAQYN